MESWTIKSKTNKSSKFVYKLKTKQFSKSESPKIDSHNVAFKFTVFDKYKIKLNSDIAGNVKYGINFFDNHFKIDKSIFATLNCKLA